MTGTDPGLGLFPALLRHWRSRTGLSQLDLALAADVSSRHISFLETGRSTPSAEMVLRLCATLGVGLRHTNAMLRAAGHPPAYPEPTPGEDLPEAIRAAVDLLKSHHEPFPLFVVDRAYRAIDTNRAAAALLARLVGASPGATRELNLARLTFDPAGAQPAIANFAEVGAAVLWRLQREVLADPDHGPLRALLDDVLAMDTVDPAWRESDPTTPAAPTLEIRLRVGADVWSFAVLVTSIQAPLTVVLEELRMEMWFPVDDVTAAGCRALANGG